MKGRFLVVGAGGGVGSAVAKRLLEQGRQVIGTVRTETQANDLRARLPGLAGVAAVDIANGDAIGPALKPFLGPDQPLAAAIVCTGITTFGPLETTPLSDFRRVMEINTVAPLAVFQACLPHLRRTGGRVAIVGSIAGMVAFPFIGHYAASKYALEALADVMRREAKRSGVGVVLIVPGVMPTPMVTAQQKLIADDIERLDPETRARYGDLYAAHQAALVTGYEIGTPADEVARILVEALDAPDPEPRYIVGPDCIAAKDMARSLSDREIDALASLERGNAEVAATKG
jgi:NAD(P)-dependent dehydrogenase (short-subunit alcohol dehydrogenase family)